MRSTANTRWTVINEDGIRACLQLRERETELRKLVEQMKKEKEDSMHQMSQLQQGKCQYYVGMFVRATYRA